MRRSRRWPSSSSPGSRPSYRTPVRARRRHSPRAPRLRLGRAPTRSGWRFGPRDHGDRCASSSWAHPWVAPMPCPTFFGRSPDCLSRWCWCSTCRRCSPGSSRPGWTACVPAPSWSRSGGEDLQPGHVYVAPGDFHLELRATARGAQTVLHQGPLVNFSRPSVDVLFHSASRVFGADLLAVVLTGMGNDGCGGSEAVVASGGTVLVQDEVSSVVWGMPGAVAKAGFANLVLPIAEVSTAIFAAVQRSRPLGGASPGVDP